jgi:hypothetical protein
MADIDSGAGSSDSDAPSASEVLDEGVVASGTLQQVTGMGIRGIFYAGFLFVISIVTGFIRILQNFLRNAAGGAGDIIANFLGALALLIEQGAIRTVNNFLLPGPLGFVEGLGWAFVGILIITQIMSMTNTDIPGLPGADFIPFFGEDADDE